MSVNIIIDNLSPRNIYQRDSLKFDTVAGSTKISLENTSGYIPGTYAVLGKIGNDSSEIVQIDGILGINDVLLKTPTQLSHERGSNFSLIYANTVKIYRAPAVGGLSPDDTQFTTIAIQNINYDETQTKWTDPTGSDQYFYKFTFYNSTTLNETSLSDSAATQGGGGLTYCSVDAIRAEAGFSGTDYVDDANVVRKRSAAQQRINGMLSGKYQLPFPKPTDPYVADLTIRLAAAYLMIEQYGAFDGTNKTLGAQKRDDVIAELKDLQNGSTVLTNAVGLPTTVSSGSGFSSGFSSDTERLFRLDDRY